MLVWAGKEGCSLKLEFHLCAFQFLFKSSAEYIHRLGERENEREVGRVRQAEGQQGSEISTIIWTDRMCASVR